MGWCPHGADAVAQCAPSCPKNMLFVAWVAMGTSSTAGAWIHTGGWWCTQVAEDRADAQDACQATGSFSSPLSQNAQVRLLERDGGTEANVPSGRECLCAFCLNESRMAVHRRPCTGAVHGRMLVLPLSLSQELSRSVALASASKSEGLYRVCLIFSHSPTYGFWENALLKGWGGICFCGLGYFYGIHVIFWSPKSFVLGIWFTEPLLWKTVSLGLITDIL